MFKKLWFRLTLVFVFVMLAIVLVLFAVINRSVESEFLSYLARSESTQAIERISEQLISHYQQNESWDEIDLSLPGSGGQGQGQGQGNEAGNRGGVRYTVYATNGALIYAPVGEETAMPFSSQIRNQAISVELDGKIIAWVLVDTPSQQNVTALQDSFLIQIRQVLVYFSIGTILIAILLGTLFGGVLSQPLIMLSDAAQEVATGKTGHIIESQVSIAEEFDELVNSFNYMSEALAQSEAQRQQMTGDIAHELRTPVSVMRTQLQAMMDGVHEIELENIARVYDQSIHLSRLVEDLRTLTQADAGQISLNMLEIDLVELLNSLILDFEPLFQDAGYAFEADIRDDLPSIAADVDRIRQVLVNLLMNALKYTKSAGEVLLRADVQGDKIIVTVSNTGVTLTQAEAKQVFHRFWRADQSRQRDTGGSGLGLAISKHLIELHQGEIWIELGEVHTHFSFSLPLNN